MPAPESGTATAAAQQEPPARRENKWLYGIVQSGAILLVAAALGLLVNHLRPDGLPLVADRSVKSRLSTLSTIEEPVISLEEAQALFFTQGAVFVDARPQEQFLSGHIQGAHNIPPDTPDQQIDSVMQDVPPDSIVITYCDGEHCALSKDLAFSLASKGFSHVRVLVNGWSVWRDAGLPVE